MSKRNAIEDTAIGNMGSTLVVGAATFNDVVGQYYAVQFLTDVAPNAIGFSNSDGYNITAGAVTFPAGTVLYGDLTDMVHTDAAAIMVLYKRV